jgi:hypothetical protein
VRLERYISTEKRKRLKHVLAFLIDGMEFESLNRFTVDFEGGKDV